MNAFIATAANTWPEDLRRAGACSEAVAWAERNSHFTAQEAWLRCERADWMLWLLGRLSGPPGGEARKPLVLCACDCAETGLQYIKREDTLAAAKEALRVARAWASGEPGVELAEVRKAAAIAAIAAYAAASADADAAYAAAYAAASAAASAAIAAIAAYAAASADADAAYAAASAAIAAARSRALREMAAIVRRHYPNAPLIGGAP